MAPVSQIVARVYVNVDDPLPVIDTLLVLDDGWSPRVAATFTVPWTAARVTALDPHAYTRVTVSLERVWHGAAYTLDGLSVLWGPALTLDGLSAQWAGLTLDDLTALWLEDWGAGARPDDVITADLVLRERTVDHVAATIACRATSDELLAQDARAHVVRPIESLPQRLTQLLAAGHVPIGPPPDFSAGAPFVSVPAETVDYGTTIWEAMEAHATRDGLRLWVDEHRVWRLGALNAPAPGTVDLSRVSDATDAVNRDQYPDVLVWVGTGVDTGGASLTSTVTYPAVMPSGPYRAVLEEHDYGNVGATVPMPTDEELAARLARLQMLDRVLTLTAPVDPTVRPGMVVTTGAPSLPATSSIVARVEWAVPADTMTITTRTTTGG